MRWLFGAVRRIRAARRLKLKNCQTFALALYERRTEKGALGYLMERPSLWRPFIKHLLYVELRPNGRWFVIAYVPRQPVHGWLPPVFFDGRIERNDAAAQLEHARRRGVLPCK